MGSRRPSAPVLIVEDNDETREVLEQILELRGYATATAEDGLAALGYLRGGNPACLIILDLRMPIMDGWALSRELQADPKFAQIPVVAFSANIDGDFPGAVATIRKAAVDPDVMLNIIDRARLSAGPSTQRAFQTVPSYGYERRAGRRARSAEAEARHRHEEGARRPRPLVRLRQRGLLGAADADGTADVRRTHAQCHAVLVLGGRAERERSERLLADRERGLVGGDGEVGGRGTASRHAARDERERHAGDDSPLQLHARQRPGRVVTDDGVQAVSPGSERLPRRGAGAAAHAALRDRLLVLHRPRGREDHRRALRAGRAGRLAVVAESIRTRPGLGAGEGDRLRQLDARRHAARGRCPGDVRLAAA